MAPRKKAESKGAHGQNHQKLEEPLPFRIETLKALIIADTLESTFRPLTFETPMVLLPLYGFPLLTYCIDFLKQSGIEQVVICTTNRKSEIQSFLTKAENTSYKTMKFEFVEILPPADTPLSFGDYIREVDGRGCDVGEDFLLMYGDTVCDFDILPAIEEHKRRRNCLITKFFTASLLTEKTLNDDACVIYDSHSHELISWQCMRSDSAQLVLDPKYPVIEKSGRGSPITIRYDLTDPGIAICSSRLLKTFAESFDHLHMRSFVQDVLTKTISTDTIYSYILENRVGDAEQTFAARLKEPRIYHTVALAMMSYRLEPLKKGLPWQGNSINTERLVFKMKDVVLADNCDVGPSVTILSATRVGSLTRIRQSIIGRRCNIGDNVVIDNCVIFDDVIIGNGVECRNSMIASSVHLSNNVIVDSGCILGSGVVIGIGHHLKRFSRLTMFEPVNDSKVNLSNGQKCLPKVADTDHDSEIDTHNFPTTKDVISKDKITLDKVQHSVIDGGKEATSSIDPTGIDPTGIDSTGIDSTSIDDIFCLMGDYDRVPEDKIEEAMRYQAAEMKMTVGDIAGIDGKGLIYRDKYSEENIPPVHLIGEDVRAQIKMMIPLTHFRADDDSLSSNKSMTSDDEETNFETKRECDAEFDAEIVALISAGLDKPDVIHHKLLEAKSFRLASDKSDADIICASVPPLLARFRGVKLDFDEWMEAFELCNGRQIFESCFDDSLEWHHFSFYDAIFDFCLNERVSAKTDTIQTSVDTQTSFLESKEALSFLLQVFARLEIVVDEFTVSWYDNKLQTVMQADDPAKIDMLEILTISNFQEYILWLRE